jgi:hypothetical protein
MMALALSIVLVGNLLFFITGVVRLSRGNRGTIFSTILVPRGCIGVDTSKAGATLTCSNVGPVIFGDVFYVKTIYLGFGRIFIWGLGCIFVWALFIFVTALLDPGKNTKRFLLGATLFAAVLSIGYSAGSTIFQPFYWDCTDATPTDDGKWANCVGRNLYFEAVPPGIWSAWAHHQLSNLQGVFIW